MAITGKPACGESGREAERVVSADGDQASDPQRFQIFDHDRGEIVVFAVEGKFFQALGVRCGQEPWIRPRAAGLVREVCSMVPPVRSMVRVFSRVSSRM